MKRLKCVAGDRRLKNYVEDLIPNMLDSSTNKLIMKRNVFDLFTSASDPVFVVDLTDEDECDPQNLSSQSNDTTNVKSQNLNDHNERKERSFFSYFESFISDDPAKSFDASSSIKSSNLSADRKIDYILDNIKNVDAPIVGGLYDDKTILADALNNCFEKYNTTPENDIADSSEACESIAISLLQSTMQNNDLPDILYEFSDVWCISDRNNSKAYDVFSTLEEKCKNTNAECLSISNVNDLKLMDNDGDDFHLSKLKQKLPRRLAFKLKEPVVPAQPLYEANAIYYPSNIKVDPPFLQRMSKSHPVLTKAKVRAHKTDAVDTSNSVSLSTSPATIMEEDDSIPLKSLKVVLSKLSFSKTEFDRSSKLDVKNRPRLMKEIENTSGYVADNRSLGHSREQKALERLIQRISKIESVDKSSHSVCSVDESIDDAILSYPKGNQALIAGVKDLRWEAKRQERKRKYEADAVSEQGNAKLLSLQIKSVETCPAKNAAQNIRQKYATHKKRGRKPKNRCDKYRNGPENKLLLDESLGAAQNSSQICTFKQGKDISGRNALHIAASSRHTASVKFILKEQPHLINDRDDDGRTPLHFAVVKQVYKIIYVLLKAGAEPNAASLDAGKRPIHEALISNASLDIIKLLVENGADPWYDLYSGESVFQLTRNESIKSYLASFMMPPSDKRHQFDLRKLKQLRVITMKSKSDGIERFKYYLLAHSVAESLGMDLNVFLNRYSFIATLYTTTLEDLKSNAILDYDMKNKTIEDIFPSGSLLQDSNIILVEYNDRARDILNSSRMTVSEAEAAWEEEQIALYSNEAESSSNIEMSCSSPDSAKTLPMCQSVDADAVDDTASNDNISTSSKSSSVIVQPGNTDKQLVETHSIARKPNHPVVVLKTILEFSKRCTANIKNLFAAICSDLQRIKSNKYCQKSTRLKYDSDCKDLIDVMKKLVTSVQNYCRHIVYYNECSSYLEGVAKEACKEYSMHQTYCSFIPKYNHHLTLVNIYRENILDITSYIGCLSWKEMQSDVSFAQFTSRMKYFHATLGENKLLLLEAEQYIRCQIYAILSTSYGLSSQAKIDEISLVPIPKPMLPYTFSSRSRQSSSCDSNVNYQLMNQAKHSNMKVSQSKEHHKTSSEPNPPLLLPCNSDVQSAAAKILNNIPSVSYPPEIINLDPIPVSRPTQEKTFPARHVYQSLPTTSLQPPRSAKNIINSVRNSANNCMSQLKNNKRLYSLVPPNNHIVTTNAVNNLESPTSTEPHSVCSSGGPVSALSCHQTRPYMLPKSLLSGISQQSITKSMPRILIRENKTTANLKQPIPPSHFEDRFRRISDQPALPNTNSINTSNSCFQKQQSVSEYVCYSKPSEASNKPKLTNLQARICKLQEKITKQHPLPTTNGPNLMKRVVVHDSDSRNNALRQIMLSKSSSSHMPSFLSSHISTPGEITSPSVVDKMKITTKFLQKCNVQSADSQFNKFVPTINNIGSIKVIRSNQNEPVEIIDLDSD